VALPRPAPGKARLWILSTLGILAMSAIAIWFGLAAVVGKPNWEARSFKVVSEKETLIKFAVSRPAGMTVRCEVQALDQAHAVVGRAEVVLGPELGAQVEQTALIRTTSRAVTAKPYQCREVKAS
jgi:hypothetical protein